MTHCMALPLQWVALHLYHFCQNHLLLKEVTQMPLYDSRCFGLTITDMSLAPPVAPLLCRRWVLPSRLWRSLRT